jgi:hypothetical protein
MSNFCRSSIMSIHKIHLKKKNIPLCIWLQDIEYIQYTVFIQCHMKYGPSWARIAKKTAFLSNDGQQGLKNALHLLVWIYDCGQQLYYYQIELLLTRWRMLPTCGISHEELRPLVAKWWSLFVMPSFIKVKTIPKSTLVWNWIKWEKFHNFFIANIFFTKVI